MARTLHLLLSSGFWKLQVLYTSVFFHLENQPCTSNRFLHSLSPKRIESKWSSLLNVCEMIPLKFILVALSEIHVRHLKKREKKQQKRARVMRNEPQFSNIFCIPSRQMFDLKTCKADGFDLLLISLYFCLGRWEMLIRNLAKYGN